MIPSHCSGGCLPGGAKGTFVARQGAGAASEDMRYMHTTRAARAAELLKLTVGETCSLLFEEIDELNRGRLQIASFQICVVYKALSCEM